MGWENTLAFRRILQYNIIMEYKHGSHSIYDLKYHVVFCTKYRYRILTGPVSERARELIREICRSNYVAVSSTKHFVFEADTVY